MSANHSLSGEVAVQIMIDGHTVPRMIGAVAEIDMWESSTSVPTCRLVIQDNNNVFKDQLALHDDNQISIALSSNEGQDKETSKFRLFKMEGVPAGSGFAYKISGIHDNPLLIKNTQIRSDDGTTSAVIRKLLGECGMRVSKKFDETSDGQVWVNPGLTTFSYINAMAAHSYRDTNALMRFGVTARGWGRYVDIIALLNRKPEHRIVFGDVEKFEGDYAAKSTKPLSQGGFSGHWVGYGYNVIDARLDGKTMKSDGVALDIDGVGVPLNKDSYSMIRTARQDYAPQDSGNTHAQYWQAFHSNMRKAALFGQGHIVQIEEHTTIELFDVVELVFPAVEMQLKDRDDATDAASGGSYLVIDKHRKWRGTKYVEFFKVVRMVVNAEGKAPLIVSDTRTSATPTEVVSAKQGKSEWSYVTENRASNPKDFCFDIVDEECMPTATDSTDFDDVDDFTDGGSQRNGPYEWALTEKVGEVKKRVRDTDPPEKY